MRFYALVAGLCSQSEAYFGQGTKVTVLDKMTDITRPTVKILGPPDEECRDRKNVMMKTLVCVASGFYPDHVSVSWEVDGQKEAQAVATDPAALCEDKNCTITSRLRVAAKSWHSPEAVFSCTVSFFNGTLTTYHTDEVNGNTRGQKVSDGIPKDEFMKVTQMAKLSYLVFIAKNVVYGVFVTILAWRLGLGGCRTGAQK